MIRPALGRASDPEVPVRQWLCSLPFCLRYLREYDRRLCAGVLGAFLGERCTVRGSTRTGGS